MRPSATARVAPELGGGQGGTATCCILRHTGVLVEGEEGEEGEGAGSPGRAVGV